MIEAGRIHAALEHLLKDVNEQDNETKAAYITQRVAKALQSVAKKHNAVETTVVRFFANSLEEQIQTGQRIRRRGA